MRALGWIVIALIPALLWMDYMRSIYHQGAFATAGVVTTPLAGLLWKIGRIAADVKATGLTTTVVFSTCAVVAFVTQVMVIGRLAFTTWDGARSVAADVARLVAPVLGWDEDRIAEEVAAFEKVAPQVPPASG